MATFGEMKVEISGLLQDPDNTAVKASSVAASINKAINYWKVKRFWFNEAESTGVTIPGNPSISLPADFLMPALQTNSFVLEYSGMRYPLWKISETAYNSMYLDNGNGQPRQYARLGNAYAVYPIPDRAYAIRALYLRDYDPLVSDTDTNDWTEETPDLITYTAAAYASRDYRQDIAMYQAFWSEAQTQYTNALTQTRKINATGSLAVQPIGGYY